MPNGEYRGRERRLRSEILLRQSACKTGILHADFDGDGPAGFFWHTQ